MKGTVGELNGEKLKEFALFSIADRVSEYEQLYTTFLTVAGISVEQAIELFAKGYILTPVENVSISDVMEELE